MRARLLWGGATLTLVLGIPLSFAMIGSAAAGAERDARDRAVGWATQTMSDVLRNQDLSEPITDDDYRDVVRVVTSEVLSDDRVLRVRIWNADGLLVYSSLQRDDVGEAVATDDDRFQQALDGQTVSGVSASRSEGARLLETFVPLTIGSDPGVSGVVEFGQDHDAIRAQAAGLWRPLQLLFALGAVACAVMLVRSERAAAAAAPYMERAGQPGADRASLKRIRALERDLKEAEGRATAADDRVASIERVKADLEQRLGAAEGELRDAVAARRGIDEQVRSATERLREMERELVMLREAAARVPLLEKEIVTLRDTVAAAPTIDQAGLDDLRRALDEAKRRQGALTAEAERLRAALAEQEAEVARRTTELEQLRPTVAVGQEEVSRAMSKLAEREAELQTIRAALAERDRQLGQARESLADRAEELRRLETLILERDQQLQQLNETVAERDTSLQQFRTAVAARDSDLAKLQAALTARDAEMEQLRALSS